jgi:hypothetical protein
VLDAHSSSRNARHACYLQIGRLCYIVKEAVLV